MPISLSVRITRIAISPRLATRTFENMAREVSGAVLGGPGNVLPQLAGGGGPVQRSAVTVPDVDLVTRLRGVEDPDGPGGGSALWDHAADLHPLAVILVTGRSKTVDMTVLLH